jgi:hypothetical protein
LVTLQNASEKIQFAIQGVKDSSNFAIAIAVGIFGVLTLFMQIHEEGSSASWIARITLSVAYWILILMGLVAHASNRMYNAAIENYINNHYSDYKEDLRNAMKGNRIMSWTINLLWLNKTTERINTNYNILTISFLVISFFLYIGIATPWTWQE